MGGAIVIRCTTTYADGRRCTCPAGHSGRHLLLREPLTYRGARDVAERWGYPANAADMAIRGAMGLPKRGPVSDEATAPHLSTDRFVSMIETFAKALLDASSKRAAGV